MKTRTLILTTLIALALAATASATTFYNYKPCEAWARSTNFQAVSPAPNTLPASGTLRVSYDVFPTQRIWQPGLGEVLFDSLPSHINLWIGPTLIYMTPDLKPEPGTNHVSETFTGLTPGTYVQALEMGAVKASVFWEGGCDNMTGVPMPGTLISGGGAATVTGPDLAASKLRRR